MAHALLGRLEVSIIYQAARIAVACAVCHPQQQSGAKQITDSSISLHTDRPWCWLMVIKVTGTPSVRLHTEGNVLESLNTHHSPGMKYVDPNLIIYIIKSAQQFPSRAPWSRERMQLTSRLKLYWCGAGTSFVCLICHSPSSSSQHINGFFFIRAYSFYVKKKKGLKVMIICNVVHAILT